MITDKDYYRITNCAAVGGFRLPNFTIEEVQQFLIKLGYKIIIHKAEAKIHITESNMGGECRRTGETFDAIREAILAVKEDTVLPTRLDSQEAHDLNFLSIFENEMKKKLLEF